MSTREKVSKVRLKDVYEKVQSGELTKYEFQQWLSTYAHKHYCKGMDEMDNICNSVLMERASPELTMDDILHGNYRLS